MVKPIGEGTYGSVYRPPLKCINKRINDKYQNKNYVMKISTESSIKDEVEIAKILRKIDPDSKYFIYLLHNKVILDVNISDINSGFVYNNPNKKYYGYYMKYGGISLDEYYHLHKNEISITLVWKWLNKLLESILLLQKYKILHLDIKTSNIVIDENDDIRLIDFGLSNIMTDDTETNLGLLIEQQYSIYPPFFNVLHCNYLQMKEMYEEINPSKLIIKKLRKSYKEDNEVYIDVSLMPNLHKMDIFSIGSIFMIYFYKRLKLQFNITNQFLTYHLNNLTTKMINPDPDKQIDIKYCMSYMNVINSINILNLMCQLKKLIWKYL